MCTLTNWRRIPPTPPPKKFGAAASRILVAAPAGKVTAARLRVLTSIEAIAIHESAPVIGMRLQFCTLMKYNRVHSQENNVYLSYGRETARRMLFFDSLYWQKCTFEIANGGL